MDEILKAIDSGVIYALPTKGGVLFTGAVQSLFLQPEFEDLGAVWRASDKAYFLVQTPENKDALDKAKKKTSAIKAVLKERGIRAGRDGVKVYDKYRAAQIRKAKRELQDVYRLALLEHQAELRQIEAIQAVHGFDLDPEGYTERYMRSKEIKAVMDELAAGLARAGQTATRIVNNQLETSANIAGSITAWNMDNAAGFKVSRFIPHDYAALATRGKASFHGKYDLKAWQGVSDKNKCRKAIKQAVTRGLLTGENPKKIAERIEGLFTGDEPLSPYKRALRIAQTETLSVMSAATLETIKAANESGFNVSKRWDSTLDGKTRDSHRKVHGEVKKPNEKFSNGLRRPGDGGPADRINCRCCLTEVLEGFKPDAPIMRDNITGKTVPYMSYDAWAEKYHPELLD